MSTDTKIDLNKKKNYLIRINNLQEDLNLCRIALEQKNDDNKDNLDDILTSIQESLEITLNETETYMYLLKNVNKLKQDLIDNRVDSVLLKLEDEYTLEGIYNAFEQLDNFDFELEKEHNDLCVVISNNCLRCISYQIYKLRFCEGYNDYMEYIRAKYIQSL